MHGDKIPDEDRIGRYVKPSAVMREDGEGPIQGIFPHAFALREGEEYLSASWIEHYPGTSDEQVSATIEAFRAAMTTSKNSVLAMGVVAEIKDACTSCSQGIRVLHEPVDDPDLPAHVAVRRFNSDNERLLSLLAESAWCDLASFAPLNA